MSGVNDVVKPFFAEFFVVAFAQAGFQKINRVLFQAKNRLRESRVRAASGD
jgi:hypothetical protein